MSTEDDYDFDVFVSYKREEFDHAKRIGDLLMHRGIQLEGDVRRLRVCYDYLQLKPTSENFDQQLKAAMDRSRCVLVLWSRRAAESDYVIGEAMRALSRRVLVNAAIDDVPEDALPTQIISKHISRLPNGQLTGRGWDQTVRAIMDYVDGEPGEFQVPRESFWERRKRAVGRFGMFVTASAFVAASVALAVSILGVGKADAGKDVTDDQKAIVAVDQERPCADAPDSASCQICRFEKGREACS
ncbi:MAG: toll/interleukin-1 receptor domain-containing protein [Hyphomonas sp.]|nr:toll/interleukin-1 receptor domain-containing protein [Hyphomonas sp.]